MTPLTRPARRRLTPGAVVAATALVLGAGGVASAAIPAADGTITAHYLKSGGTLRVIDAEAGQTCKSNETQLDSRARRPAGRHRPGWPGRATWSSRPGGCRRAERRTWCLGGHEVIDGPESVLDPGQLLLAFASCPESKVVTGGGPSVATGWQQATTVESSRAAALASGWPQYATPG